MFRHCSFETYNIDDHTERKMSGVVRAHAQVWDDECDSYEKWYVQVDTVCERTIASR